MVEISLKDHGALLRYIRLTIKSAVDHGHEGSIELRVAYLRKLEKTDWVLDS